MEENGNKRITKDCNVNGSNKYALDWQSNKIYKSWPNAVEFTEDEIGVNNKKSYMNFQEQFSDSGASFIWSSNLV